MKGVRNLRLALAGIAAGALLLAGGLLLTVQVKGEQITQLNSNQVIVQQSTSGSDEDTNSQRPSTDNGNDYSWLIAALSVAGVAALVGYGFLHANSRSW